MSFSQPITDLIRNRTSVRSYLPIPIDEHKREKLNSFMDNLEAGPFGSRPRFKLLAASENSSSELRSLGTYGFIKGAVGYIISVVTDEDRNLEDLGWQMEKIILYATELGLGTCWLGGTFTKSSFASKMDLQPGELIPAAAAIGTPAPQQSLVEKLTRRGANADQRLPWDELFFAETYGIPLKEAGEFSTPLEMLRLAPSASNRQPWRMVKQQDCFHLFMQRSPGYRERRLNRLFTNADMQRIDMGIAMCHFELSSRELGLPGKWAHQPPALDLPEAEIEYLTTWVM